MDHNASDALVDQPQNVSCQPYVLTSVKEEVQGWYLLTTGNSQTRFSKIAHVVQALDGEDTHKHTHGNCSDFYGGEWAIT
jgi:hypothetical protein